jgi:hypothetical protein
LVFFQHTTTTTQSCIMPFHGVLRPRSREYATITRPDQAVRPCQADTWARTSPPQPQEPTNMDRARPKADAACAHHYASALGAEVDGDMASSMGPFQADSVRNSPVSFDCCPASVVGTRTRVCSPILKKSYGMHVASGCAVELQVVGRAAARLIQSCLAVVQKNDLNSSTFLPIRVAVPGELTPPPSPLDRR